MNFIPSATKSEPKPALSPAALKKKKQDEAEHSAKAMRETIESIVIAIILAFLFRTFEAEAFVIPTGSMAPTLQGRHKDVECPQCHYRYRTGASEEERSDLQVVGTICPICSYPLALDPQDDPNEDSFTGDRILVSKFAYQLNDPERWDAIVFKFPGNAKQNYIKRLIGLPNEHVRIFHGDVFITKPGEAQEHIARKPPYKLADTLQLVDDTANLSDTLVQLKWPSRWQEWLMPGVAKPAAWTMAADGRSFSTTGEGDEAWLRYKHVLPIPTDWDAMVTGALPPDLQGKSPVEITAARQRLIGDFCTYNESLVMSKQEVATLARRYRGEEYRQAIRDNWYPHTNGPQKPEGLRGEHWVGDLGVEANVTVTGTQGELLFTLIEGGVHYSCRIDVATGVAKFEINRGATDFVSDNGEQKTQFPAANTTLRGPGTYRVRMTNCNDELLLWVNDELAKFDGPTTYANRPDSAPQWSLADPGDIAPVGIGSKGAAFTVSDLRVVRDVYYIAAGRKLAGKERTDTYNDDYFLQSDIHHRLEKIDEVFTNPQLWATTDLFASRVDFPIQLEADQFFPLGDNSPASQDARSWPGAPFVSRELLIGKALLIYWPHAWNRPIPFTPNVQRMGIIH